ncbi:HYR domain-containing protein [Sediminibacterium sp. WSJ-3]|nr:HYR domain-containing protein [Sediminibacterium soli]
MLKLFAVLGIIVLASQASAQTAGSGLHFLYQSSAPGVRNSVIIPDNGSLNISSNITLEAWVKFSVTSGKQDVISKSSYSTNNGYIFPRTDDGWRHLRFMLYVNTEWKILEVNYGTDKANQWHHLAATYDGFYMRIFIDGVLAGSLAASGNIKVNTNPVTLGNQTGYTNEYFTGSLDEVRIWNRALSACEISNSKDCELSGSETGLAAYYKFNQGQVGVANALETTAYDASPNGNNGTLNGFLLTGLTSNWTTGAVTTGSQCGAYVPVQATAGSLSAAVAVGDNINLTASGGDSYAWVGPNGFTSTAQNAVVTSASLASAGIYTVTVTRNGCSASASTTIAVADRAKALLFDGVDDEIRIANSASLNSNSFTLETWMFPTSASPAMQSVVSKATVSPDKGFIFPRTDDGWMNCAVWLTVNGVWQSYAVPFPGLNKWTHVATTYDGFDLRIYINGLLVKSENLPGNVNWSSADMILGGQPGYVQHYKGKLDEMRIWNRALSQCELQNNITCELNGANNGLAGLTGLSAYYRFNQGLQDINNTGQTTLVDSSGYANNGTLFNFDLNSLLSNWTSGGSVNNATCTPFQATAVTIGSNGPVVEVGQPIQLTVSGGTSWSWTGPNGFTSIEQNPVISNSTTAMSGLYSVAVTGNGCTTTANTRLQVAFKAYSLHFDGVNDQITVPNASSLNMNTQLSLEAWLYPTDNTRAIQDVMSKSSLSANNGYIFPRTDNAWSSYTFYLHVNGQWNILAAPYPGLNQWHHVAATYDGYYMRIYLDGVLSASKEVYGTITQNTNDLVLGQQPGFTEYYRGYVDEARIWNRALSQCEIINNMKCELIPAQQSNLVAYYKFNQGFGDADNSSITQLVDATAQANHGLLQNFALQGLASNWATYYSTEKGSGTCVLYSEPPVIAQANGANFAVGSTIKLFSNGGTQYFWNGPNNFSATGQTVSVNNAQLPSSGTYTVTVPFVNCVVNKSVRVNVTNIAPIAASGPLSFCPSGSVTLTNPNTGSAYQWFRNDTLIEGATAISYTATQSGRYAIGVTNSGKVTISEGVTVTVEDRVAPVPVLTQLPTLNLVSPATVTVFPTATDDCAGTITATTVSPLTYANAGTYTILWKYDDGHGNTATQGQNVVVTRPVDVLPPVITVPAPVTLSATACAAVANFTATATDDSGDPVTITYSQNPGTQFPIGNTTVTVTAKDVTGNTAAATFVVTVADNTAPVLVLPADIVANTGTGINVGVATATDNCGVPVVTHGTIPAVFPLGVTSIVWTATDAAGNTASGIQKVTVNDITGPVLNGVPANTIANCGVLPSVPTVTATDNFDPAPVVTMTESVNGNTVTRTWKAVDASNNSTYGSQVITVIPVPAAPVVSVADNCGGSVLTATGTNLVWSTGATASSISVVNAGTFTVTQTVDGCTSAAASAVAAPKAIPAPPAVAVSDNCGSSLLTAAGSGLVWSTGAATAAITVNAGTYTVTQSVNNCTSAPASVVAAPKAVPAAPMVTVVSNCGSTVLSTAAAGELAWSNGATTASITVTANGAYQVTATVNGCISPAAVTNVTIATPVVLPAITGNTAVRAGSTTQLANTVSGGVWSSDNADIATVNASGLVTGVTAGNTAINYTVTTQQGCTTTVSVTITVSPACIAPVLSADNVTAKTPAGATGCNAPVTYPVNITADPAASAITYTFSGATTGSGNGTGSGAVFNTGVTTVVVKAVNACGSATTTFTVTLTDGTAPVPNVATLPVITGQCSVSLAAGTACDCADYAYQYRSVVSMLISYLGDYYGWSSDDDYSCTHSTEPANAPKATDNCKGTIVGTTTDPLTYTAQGTYVIHWKYDDGNGNTTIQEQTVIVKDDAKPTISDVADITVACGSSTDPSVTGRPVASDACSAVTTTYTDVVNGSQITRTWKATDAAGNYSTSVQIITVVPAFSVSVSSVPTSSTYTGGASTNLYLGYGAQSTKLQVGQLPSAGAPYSYAWSGSAVNKLNSTSSAAPTFTPSAAGSYTFVVTATNKYGCTATSYITICVTDIRVPGSNGKKVYICHRTSSKKNPTVTIEVSINAVPAHLVHGNCGKGDEDDRLGSCDQAPCGTTSAAFASTGTTQGSVTTEGAMVTKEAVTIAAEPETLKVLVMPNPSTTYFTLKFNSASQAPLNLRVMDGTGRVVDAKSQIGANSTLQIGHNYTSGTYYAEIIQGTQRQVIQLIKAKG